MAPSIPHWITVVGILTTLTSAVVLPLDAHASRSNSKCRKTKVAVLGAGVAGITAAQTLHNASISDFVIIDRNDYIGGRMHHTTFGKDADGKPYTIELGANWVQGLGSPGGPENPIWRLAKKYHLKNTYSNYSSILTYDHTGQVDYTNLLDKYEDIADKAATDAGEILINNLQDTNAKAGLAVQGWKPSMNDMHAQAVEWWEWDWEAGFSPELSSFAFGVAGNNASFDQFSDANNYVWDQRGFNTWLIGEANEFLKKNDPRLILEKIVQKVSYSDKGVTIDLEDGQCVEAEHAICTFSLGVLKHEGVEFEPKFPKWKRDALELMDMGTYTKVFYQFNETFWSKDTQYFLYADPKERGHFPVWQSLSGPGFIEESNIIFATVVHDQSYDIENQDPEKTKEEGLAVLRRMFPHVNVPEPIDFLYPKWSTEEWSYGSYSNFPASMSLQKHQNLRANLDRLWFAGEANSAEYFGFLQGAWFEGQEVGARVAGMLGGKTVKIGINSNYTVSGPMAKYEILHGTTFYDEYNEGNGWDSSTILA